ncbi:MAG: spermidine synthase [Planctomycetes bacterium]|nr:spermidine synthase [Planctomycetota bacterium]
MIRYAATIFVSAFLLFQVQPLIGRFILPWFGGTAAVWSVAMLFFQGVLLAGYAYAHFSIARLKPGAQLGVHLALLALCVFWLPIIPPESLKPDGAGAPTLRIMLLLGASVGLPYFALSSTGPLLQAWFSRSFPERSPYALYALSNVGSLLALLSYPFAIEPMLGRMDQAWSWTWVYVGFSILCAVAAISAFRASPKAAAEPVADAPSEVNAVPGRSHTLLWIAFAAAGSCLLLAFTNQLCMDIASVPLLWVLPLSIYLLSFVFTFAGKRWYPRKVFLLLLPVAMLGTALGPSLMFHLSLPWIVALYLASLFVFCMVCHGEAFRLRPPPQRLTRFYLSISIGGVIGGVFVAVLSPLLFTMYVELPAGVLATGALVLISLARDPASRLYDGKPRWAWLAILIVAVGAMGGLGYGVLDSLENTIDTSRSFYGVYRVRESPEGTRWERILESGNTLHGHEFMGEGRVRIPTSYYGTNSGVGVVLGSYPDDQKLRVGVVGLGAGTIATYARPGDEYRFYEIDPHVLELAKEYFRFIETCRGDLQVVIGDARLQLESEAPQQFDVLVLDAFSSDAIPVHLLTAESFELYRSHLKPGGVICVHISNRYLDLRPIVIQGATGQKLKYVGWLSAGNEREGTSRADWMILCDGDERMDAIAARFDALRENWPREDVGDDDYWPLNFGSPMSVDDVPEIRPWTDDYSNLLSIID